MFYNEAETPSPQAISDWEQEVLLATLATDPNWTDRLFPGEVPLAFNTTDTSPVWRGLTGDYIPQPPLSPLDQTQAGLSLASPTTLSAGNAAWRPQLHNGGAAPTDTVPPWRSPAGNPHAQGASAFHIAPDVEASQAYIASALFTSTPYNEQGHVEAHHGEYGYPSGVTPPPQVFASSSPTMALLTPQQQPEAQPYLYGDEGVDPKQLMLATVNSIATLPDSHINVNPSTHNERGHGVPSIVLGTTNGAYMNLPLELTETRAPLQFSTAPALPAQLDGSCYGLPTGTSWKPAMYEGPSTFPWNQLATHNHTYPGAATPAHAPPQPQIPPYDRIFFQELMVIDMPMLLCEEKVQTIRAALAANRPIEWKFQNWGLGRDSAVVLPESPFNRCEEAAGRVLVEWMSVLEELKCKGWGAVDFAGNFYITTWDLFKQLTDSFLRCHEGDCRSVVYYFHTSAGLKGHLEKHVQRKVVLEPGETVASRSYKERVAEEGGKLAAGEIYAPMIQRYKNLALLVREVANKRLLQYT